VYLDDIKYFEFDDGLDASEVLMRIVHNAYRYKTLFEEAASRVMPPTLPDPRNAFSVLTEARKKTVQEARQRAHAELEGAVPVPELPAFLTHTFEVVLVPLSDSADMPVQGLRDVRATHIGRLTKIRGIVTRVAEVVPRIVVACYTCDVCSTEVYRTVVGRDFTPETDCQDPLCRKQRHGAPTLALRVKYSRFEKYQEFRVQELPDQVPIGNVPRTVVVEARGENTRQCSAGDIVTVSGCLLPDKRRHVGRTGTQQSGLVSQTYLYCMDVARHKKSYADIAVTPELTDKVRALRQELGEGLYPRLAQSLAPEIYGHADVKKAILLMLVGGSTTTTGDGMRIRGDINIALFGDPGVAKSQLLKHVIQVAPRAVYTTGKGSSGVGLTAAVVRDAVTGETALEGGALVLADMGICCIDEFDKMDDADRTAIHEVMEQQTVSIAKAGITTTLNARTAILAAANPMYGRWNKKISATENINLPAALLSRFDLLFLLLDKTDQDTDRSLAQHVTHVHQFSKHPELTFTAFEPVFIREFIAQARALHPVIPNGNDSDPRRREQGKRVTARLVEAFVDMRKQDQSDQGNNHAQSAMTPRHLLSILRLATAHARVRGSALLSEDDVDEAIRLVVASKASLEDDEPPAAGVDKDDAVSKIYRKIVEFWNVLVGGGEDDDDLFLEYVELESKVLRLGFTREQLNKTLEVYSQLNSLAVNAARTKVRLVNGRDQQP